MKLEATRTDGFLLLRYEVRNDLGEDLFLCNLVPDTAGFYSVPGLSPSMKGQPRKTPELAYACLAAPDTVAFLQGDLPLPKGYTSTAPVVPLFTKVAPGESFSATIRASIPLLEWHAYAKPTTEWSESALVSRVKLRVDYVLRSKADYLLAVRQPEGAFQVRQYPDMPSLRAETALKEPIPMLIRSDAFTRFEP